MRKIKTLMKLNRSIHIFISWLKSCQCVVYLFKFKLFAYLKLIVVNNLGDATVLLRGIGGAEYANSRGKLEEFCNEHKIRLKGIIEARKIRIQLTNEINLANPDLNLVVNPTMEPPSDIQVS